MNQVSGPHTHKKGQSRLSIEDFAAFAPAFPDIDVALLCTTLLVAQSLHDRRHNCYDDSVPLISSITGVRSMS